MVRRHSRTCHPTHQSIMSYQRVGFALTPTRRTACTPNFSVSCRRVISSTACLSSRSPHDEALMTFYFVTETSQTASLSFISLGLVAPRSTRGIRQSSSMVHSRSFLQRRTASLRFSERRRGDVTPNHRPTVDAAQTPRLAIEHDSRGTTEAGRWPTIHHAS